MGLFSKLKKHIRLFIKLKKEKTGTLNIEFKEKNILIIDYCIPEFDKDSGSRRMYKIIQALIESNYQVFLVTDQNELSFNDKYAHYYEKMGVTVYKPHLIGFKTINIIRFLKLITPKIDTAIISRPDTFKKYHPIIKNLNSKCTIIYDMVDFHYIRNLREYQLNNSVFALSQAEKYKKIETENCKLADITYVVSKTDKQLLRDNNIYCNKIAIISNIHDSIKIDHNFIPFNKRKDLLFIGGFKHTPNIDAVLYLYHNVLPLILAKNPNIKVNIVGSNLPDNIRELENDNFVIHGYAPNVDVFFNNSKLFIAPLQYGAGIKGKIGQSLEFNLPLVTTDIGAEGFDFSPLENIMIANTPEKIANQILELYNNEKIWNEVCYHSKTILQPFSYESTKATLVESLTK